MVFRDVTTIQLLDVADPPSSPPPLNPRIAVLVVAILVIGGGILAALAGPEPAPGRLVDPEVVPAAPLAGSQPSESLPSEPLPSKSMP